MTFLRGELPITRGMQAQIHCVWGWEACAADPQAEGGAGALYTWSCTWREGGMPGLALTLRSLQDQLGRGRKANSRLL